MARQQRRLSHSARLREECAKLERHVRQQGLAEEEELRAYRPGGEENPDRKVWGWTRFYAQLVRFLQREEQRAKPQTPEETDRLILAALRSEPLPIELTDGSTVLVYPKGMAALLDLDLRERVLGWIGLRYSALLDKLGTASAEPELLELCDRVRIELTRQQAALVMVACRPGPEPPPDSFTSEDLPIDERWLNLDPVDLVRINAGFHAVNSGRIQALDAFLSRRRSEGQERPTWAQFVGNLSRSFKRPPRELMHDVALAELLAGVAVAVESDERAKQQARAETDQSRDIRGKGALARMGAA